MQWGGLAFVAVLAAALIYEFTRGHVRWRELKPEREAARRQEILFVDQVSLKIFEPRIYGWAKRGSAGYSISIGASYIEIYGPRISQPLGCYWLLRTRDVFIERSNEPGRVTGLEWIVLREGGRRIAIRSKNSNEVLWNVLMNVGSN